MTEKKSKGSGIKKFTALNRRAEKENFFSTAVHQLRTPLTTIRFITEGLLADAKEILTENQRRKIQMIKEVDERAINLVNDMLDVSKMVTKELEPIFEACNLPETIKSHIEVLEPAAEAKNQKIIFTVGGDVHIVNICNKYFIRAFSNILDNAISYGDDNSQITVTLTENTQHDSYLVSVHNFGPIIPKEELPKIFQKFHRAPGVELLKPIGTGLGLFIAKSAIELNGGRIWIESEKGKGTTVYFTVPFKAPAGKIK